MRHCTARGFTLVEAMVAAVIVSIMLLAMGGMLLHNMRSNQGSEQRMDAAAVSQSILGEYSARLLAHDWVPGSGPVSGVKSGYKYTLSARQSTDGSHTILAVTLEPQQGSRMLPYSNQTLVTVVGSSIPPASPGTGKAGKADGQGKSTSGEGGKDNASVSENGAGKSEGGSAN